MRAAAAGLSGSDFVRSFSAPLTRHSATSSDRPAVCARSVHVIPPVACPCDSVLVGSAALAQHLGHFYAYVDFFVMNKKAGQTRFLAADTDAA